MKKDKPDNIVFSEEHAYNASLLPYATSVGHVGTFRLNSDKKWIVINHRSAAF